jgi:hypothetical protein
MGKRQRRRLLGNSAQTELTKARALKDLTSGLSQKSFTWHIVNCQLGSFQIQTCLIGKCSRSMKMALKMSLKGRRQLDFAVVNPN